MTEPTHDPFTTWESFYVIVGSSGAGLIGVQFVVITLISSIRKRVTAEPISAFATPTVVHFVMALVVSALMSAPWHSLAPPSVALALCGLGGIGYGATVIRRARRQTEYRPVLEDWIWYGALPCTAYVALALAAFWLRFNTPLAAFLVAAAALALLLIGIHNAWDTVTHLVLTADDDATSPSAAPRAPSSSQGS
jgi:hypothetical protein